MRQPGNGGIAWCGDGPGVEGWPGRRGLPASVMVRFSHYLPCDKDRKKMVTPALGGSEVKFAL